MYQFSNEAVLFDWLARETDITKREAMLDFMSELAETPADLGVRVPGSRKPVYVAPTRVEGWVVRYMVVEQFETVVLAGFARLP